MVTLRRTLEESMDLARRSIIVSVVELGEAVGELAHEVVGGAEVEEGLRLFRWSVFAARSACVLDTPSGPGRSRRRPGSSRC